MSLENPLIRCPVTGVILALNHGAWTGLYSNVPAFPTRPVLLSAINDAAFLVGEDQPWVDTAAHFFGATSYALVSPPSWAFIIPESGLIIVDAREVRADTTITVVASNAAGSVQASFQLLVAADATAPAVVTPIADQSFEIGSGDQTLDVFANFSGDALVFTVTAGPATITEGGVLTIPTGTAQAGVSVTVKAENDLGDVSDTFLLTVTEEVTGGTDPDFPATISGSAWTAVAADIVNGARRSTVTINANAVAMANATFQAGFVLEIYRGTVQAGEDEWFIPFPNFNTAASSVWNSNSGMAPGITVWHALRYRRLSDGTVQAAATSKSFLAEGDGTTPIPTDPGSGGPTGTPNASLPTASGSALRNWLIARRDSGATGTYILQIPPGNYGTPNLTGIKMPGMTIIRAQNLSDSIFGGVNLWGARNITFQKCVFNGQIELTSAQDMAIEYCDLYAGTNVRHATLPGYVSKVDQLIRMYKDETVVPNIPTRNITIRMNYIHGAAGNAIYAAGGSSFITIVDNMFNDVEGDAIKIGIINDSYIARNWGPRRYWCAWSEQHQAFTHNDWMQIDGRGGICNRLVFEENVIMRGDADFANGVVQAYFSSKSGLHDCTYRKNISFSTSIYGVSLADRLSGTLTVHDNSLLRTISTNENSQIRTTIDSRQVGPGPVTMDVKRNVICDQIGYWAGFQGLVIPTKTGTAGTAGVLNANAMLTYFHAAGKTNTFYECRPIDGAGAHNLGAYQTFDKIINGGQWPNYGYAFWGWKAAYDWKNQITAAA